jgi:hypothetical protein
MLLAIDAQSSEACRTAEHSIRSPARPMSSHPGFILVISLRVVVIHLRSTWPEKQREFQAVKEYLERVHQKRG